MVRGISILLLLLLPLSISAAEPDAKIPPIQMLKGVRPNSSVFKGSSRRKPLVIKSEKEAAEYFSKDALAALQKQVDFEQEVLLIFAWRGSGQDRLLFDVDESYPEQISFRYKPGRTKDLRQHLYLFALRSNVKWRASK